MYRDQYWCGLGVSASIKNTGGLNFIPYFHKSISSSNSHKLHTSKSLTTRRQPRVGSTQAQRPEGLEFARVQARKDASGSACARLGEGAREQNPEGVGDDGRHRAGSPFQGEGLGSWISVWTLRCKRPV